MNQDLDLDLDFKALYLKLNRAFKRKIAKFSIKGN